MAKLDIQIYDRTLTEVDKALEQDHNKQYIKNYLQEITRTIKKKIEEPENKRHYLGMSQVGEECHRKLFYVFRNAETKTWSASSLKAIEDGFLQEDVMASRLRLLPFIELHTVDASSGEQIAFSLLLDHFRGHCDGVIKGLIESPQTWHIWEHKSVNQAKFDKLISIREKKGEKNALIEWDYTYYCQAIIYMHEAGLDRHFLTVSSPGGREFISIRTEYNKKTAEAIIAKAQSIIFDNWQLPAPISLKREYFRCGWCEFKELCHDGKFPLVNCKTCRYREPIKNAENQCLKHEKILTEFEACPDHVYNPALIQAKLLKHEADGCIYQLESGLKLANTALTGMPGIDNDSIDFIYTSAQLRNDIVLLSNLKVSVADTVTKSFMGGKKAWAGKKDSRLKDI